MSHIAEMLADLNLDVGTADNEDIVTAIACGNTLQAWEMVSLFPGQPQYHVATPLRSALILLGCVGVEE